MKSNPLNVLSRDDRSLINKRANELSRKAYDAYQWRLIEWAAIEKQRTGKPITFEHLQQVVPDITDDLGGDE